jgi:hypothetical protein
MKLFKTEKFWMSIEQVEPATPVSDFEYVGIDSTSCYPETVKAETAIQLDISDSEYVRLSEIEQFSDGSGWCSTIKVSTAGFACTGRKFYFGDPAAFLEGLAKAHKTLKGIVELKTPNEDELHRNVSRYFTLFYSRLVFDLFDT